MKATRRISVSFSLQELLLSEARNYVIDLGVSGNGHRTSKYWQSRVSQKFSSSPNWFKTLVLALSLN